MILQFPELETLSLALTSGILPDSISLQPAEFAENKAGHLLVNSSATISREVLKDLKQIGVVARRSGKTPHKVCCWLQILPVEREHEQRNSETGMNGHTSTPVLFELTDSHQLPEVAGEILRLGNYQQSFRWLEAQDLDNAPESKEKNNAGMKTLLRVINPPYYSLLRATEPNGSECAPRAYREQHQRVWVELGYQHPLSKKIKPPANHELLIDATGQWQFIKQAPYRDIHEILEFTLQDSAIVYEDTERDDRLEVPLRLTRGTSLDNAELWVVEEESISQLDELVRTSSQRLLSRLLFAVVERENAPPIVLLKVRPGKESSPVLVLNAVGYAPFLKLPNLFVPVGLRVHPPLKREMIKKLLADDIHQLNWLRPEESGQFQSCSVSEKAFRPLAQWVDYTLDREREKLQPWMESTQFKFESYICIDPDKPDKNDRDDKDRKRSDREKEGQEPEPSRAKKLIQKVTGKKTAKKSEPEQARTKSEMSQTKAKPDALRLHLKKLEASFLEMADDTNTDTRRKLWVEMARVHGQLGQSGEATICWANALWDREQPDPEALLEWCSVELKRESAEPLLADELDGILKSDTPSPSQLNALAAHLAWNVHNGLSSRVLHNRLSQLQEFLEKYEGTLSARVAWLAWRSLFQISEGDVLALARARDRLLERLFQQGLSPGRELPGFLRASGIGAADRFRAVRERIVELRDHVQFWRRTPCVEKLPKLAQSAKKLTGWYIDLLFAFAFAKLGDHDVAEDLITSAREGIDKAIGSGGDKLKRLKPVYLWILAAYSSRIHQAIAAKPTNVPLQEELLTQLTEMNTAMKYVCDSVRRCSIVLEPAEKIESHFKSLGGNSLTVLLAKLSDLRDPESLERGLDQFLNDEKTYSEPEERSLILRTALSLAHRLGETRALPLLELVEPVYDQQKVLTEKARLLTSALQVAGHYDQPTFVHQFFEHFESLINSTDLLSEKDAEELAKVLRHSFRNLRRLGMREELQRVLVIVTQLLERSRAKASRKKRGKKSQAEIPVSDQPEYLQLLLGLTIGRFYSEEDPDLCQHDLDLVREVLFTDQPIPEQLGVEDTKRVDVTCDYLDATSQDQVEKAMARMTELFAPDPENKRRSLLFNVVDKGGQTEISLAQLRITESLILALVSDDFSLDQAGRHWLNDDEYRIRSQVHHDVRQAMHLAET